MDINIRTIDESRASRVKVVFQTDAAGERVVEFSGHNAEVELKPEERDSKQVERADRKAEMFKKPAREDTDRVAQLNYQVTKLEHQVKELDRNRHAQRQLADMYCDRVTELDERLRVRTQEVEDLRQSVAARDSILNKTTDDLRKISGAVFSDLITEALDSPEWSPRSAEYLIDMKEVVEEIRNVLGGARGPYSPTD